VNDVSHEASIKSDAVAKAPSSVSQAASSVELMVVDARNSVHVYAVKGGVSKGGGEASGQPADETLGARKASKGPSVQHGDIRGIALAMASTTEAGEKA
jgi:hypothetical protein